MRELNHVVIVGESPGIVPRAILGVAAVKEGVDEVGIALNNLVESGDGVSPAHFSIV
jgi:hypothetical protein